MTHSLTDTRGTRRTLWGSDDHGNASAPWLRRIVPVPMGGSREADAALMRQIAGGEKQACRLLVERHAPRMLRLAYRMLGDTALAEDVVQEVFLRLWRQSSTWRPEARIDTWIYRVVHNLCVDELRTRRRLSDEEPPDRADPADGPATVGHRGQVATQVNAAIAALPPRQRAAITLVYHQEMSNIEAAQVMGVTVEAVESLLTRARRKLKQQLSVKKEDLTGEP